MSRQSLKAKYDTPCKVAVPRWAVDKYNLGHCRKYQPFYNALQETHFMLCVDTKLPCPLGGTKQYPVDEPVLLKWMKETKYAI